ncbi:MAG: hypothetical protein A2Y98_01040 [Candidatus Portnoybacteria bacterium RBG_19FT_COMBO_36_7]|uniref:Glycosyl transferase family 1 domain-containing protein n=1 Tax=Candidatus Portnoybacteria bacterium RBG_19FT_COMBO_36_7 TaxID=1801992 RepID=A0A1G2F915_9BACT|nr:MAG: hypothetical protein A2Y98_01040 [Candidatus Portnoybacteria bacterium RBG_19FT_COMBO_36_7]
MPSRFEPCGLGQMIAMRYGTVPIARAVGGLKDTIENMRAGFLFEKYESREFLNAIEKALDAFKDKTRWKQIQTNGMKKDFSWEASAKVYLCLYKKLIEENF